MYCWVVFLTNLLDALKLLLQRRISSTTAPAPAPLLFLFLLQLHSFQQFHKESLVHFQSTKLQKKKKTKTFLMFNALPSTPSDTTTTTASKAACDSCRSRKKKCDGLSPCALCCQRGIECVFTAARKRGPKALKLDSSSARPAKTLSCSSSFAFNDAAVDAKDVLSSCKTSSLSPSCNPLSTPTLLPDSSLSSSTNATISTSGSPTDTIPFFSGFSDLSTLPDLRKFTAAVAGVDVVQHLPKTTASILSVAEQNRLALERFLIYEFFGTVHTAFSLFDHVIFS